MKKNTTLRFALLIFFSIGLYAQDFYTYKLFNNEFQAVFPGQPSVQEIPEELLDSKAIENSLPYEYRKELTQKQINKIVSDTMNQFKMSQPYIYTDMNNQLSFTAQTMPSQVEHKNYIWSGIKNLLDDLVKKGLKANKANIINFSSSLDKNKDTYIAIYTYSYYIEGQKVYSSTKHIYYKDKIYKWTVGYVNKANKSIFDNYKKHSKVIK